jgi:ubiquinone/menaquinone biosynthesis C-methylase UbiE
MDTSDSKRIAGERRFWNKVAREYDNWIANAFPDQYIVNKAKLLSVIQPEDTILEIGCGAGDMAFHLSPNCKKIMATDLSPDMISVAKRRLSKSEHDNLTFQVEDSYNLSFSDNSYDKVICINALQVMKEPNRAVGEGFRVLKDGGDFLSITYLFGESGIVEYFKLTKWVIRYGKPKYWHNFKRGKLVKIFQDAGFIIEYDEIIWKKPKVLFLGCKKSA